MRHRVHNRHRGLFALLAAVVLAVALPADAQQWDDDADVDMGDQTQDERPQEQPDEPDAEPEDGADDVEPEPTAVERERAIREATRRQIDTAQNEIHIYQLAEEMIDEVVADISELNTDALTPAALRKLSLTPNLHVQFGEFVEASLVTALATHTDVAVKRCIACDSIRTRVDDDDWVVTRGLVEQDDLSREAERLGADTFLDARFSYFPGANMVAMQVEFFRADDGEVLWTETYRSDATTAAILRTGDRVASREERVEELERRIDERPYYGHQLVAGAGYIPYDAPSGGIGGAIIGYRLYEKFGPEKRYLYGVGADGFANFDDEEPFLGSFIYATVHAEIFNANLNSPTVRTGPMIGGFFAGTEGNSFVAEWNIEATLQFRLGAAASLFYYVPVEFAGNDLGGFGAKGKFSFNW